MSFGIYCRTDPAGGIVVGLRERVVGVGSLRQAAISVVRVRRRMPSTVSRRQTMVLSIVGRGLSRVVGIRGRRQAPEIVVGVRGGAIELIDSGRLLANGVVLYLGKGSVRIRRLGQ